MNNEDLKLEAEAFKFIKENKKELIKKFANPNFFKPVLKPVSLFMAGSPGAGKTEVSKNLTKRFHNIPIRIDADEIRKICPGYIGLNAHAFQRSANKGVNILFDYALKYSLNIILDGTFAYGGALENVKRSLKHKRTVELWFIYQDPIKAWEVTKAREEKESRHVSKDVFIKTFFESRKNIASVKSMFGKSVQLNLLIKDYDNNQEKFRLNITTDELDSTIESHYDEDELKKLLE